MSIRMPRVNALTLCGRLCRDPELKYTAGGMAAVKTSMAVDDGYGDKKRTIFVTLQMWGAYAEKTQPKLYKGAPVLVEGRLDVYEYETRDGDKRTEVVCVANRVQVLEWRDDPADGNAPPSPATPERETQDDIPF
jgi:single-strand DNA-binding protein